MKCYACGKIYPLSQWRVINLEQMMKSTIRPKTNGVVKQRPTTYYTVPGSDRFANIYACPHCGTVRVKTPTDKN